MNAPDKYSSEQVELKGVLAEFREALEEEIDKIKQSGQSSTLLYAGRQVESHSPEFWYRFNVEYIPSLPADTPCKLLIGKDQFDVTVISLEENSIIISSKSLLPDTIGKARLENGATVLMERLIKCIEENAAKTNDAGKRMLQQDGSVYSFRKVFSYNDLALSKENTQSQNTAIASALTNDITYIWGPPGTGKTTVIGQIINELHAHNRSALIVSHTNTAVDGAIEKADKYYNSHPDSKTSYPILRIGTPAKALPEKVLLNSHVKELGKELCEQMEALEKQQAELQHRIHDILPLLAKDAWSKENKLAQIQEIVQTLSEHEKKIRRIQDEIDSINASMQQEKAEHPEYSRYLILAKEFKSKKNEYDSICDCLDKAETAIRELPLRIQNALDEIRKHDRYAELREQESRYMSVQFLQNERSKIDARISDLVTEINTLSAKRTAAQQTISDYEKKNSVIKLFAGRSAVTQAQSTLHSANIRLAQVGEELQCQHRLEQEYKQQFENLLLLQEQIRAVIPTETQAYWSATSNQLQADLVAAKSTLPGLSAQKDALFVELSKLQKQQTQAKASFDILSELGRKLRQAQDSLEKARMALSQENSRCTELLKRECSICASFFYQPFSETIPELFDELSKLLITIKAEMDAVDVAALQQEKEQAESDLVKIFRQLHEIRQKMRELEKQAIMNAKIIGTTLAKSYLSEVLRERIFDTVILDEASMASIPALWCASYLAENSIVIVGDFLQLPPIVMAETPMAKKWLGKDIFYHSGMQERAKDKTTCPDNFVMLNEQFRMESDIADIANMYYGAYGGLRSNDAAECRVNERKSFNEWYSKRCAVPCEQGSKTRTEPNIRLIDTESLHAWVTGVPQGKSHSRLNCFSAAVDVDLAFMFLENKLKKLDPASAKPEEKASVLIVAPYKPHIARVNQLIELEYRNRGFKENPNFIRAGTIHSFQGSEADIVIFDLVIDEPHWRANLFMTDKEINEDLRKMFNVAITRARFKLFIVGNFSYCQKRAKNNALAELLDKLLKTDHLAKEDAKELFPDIAYSKPSDFSVNGSLTGKHIVCREESFNDYFMADVYSFKKRLIVYSPFMTENRLSVLLPAFADAIKAGKQIIVVTKALSDRGKMELVQYQKCEKELRDIGVSVLHKKSMHEKLIFVDSKAVWIGSLNALSFSGLTGEIMQRHADESLTAEYQKLFDIDHICGAIENAYEQKCPICGHEMIVKESAEGGIYWECMEGDYSRNAAQQYPVDGILRCKCGAPFIFAMKNEPRWVCSEDSRHFQKMRESDLKLEKMAALIPTKASRKEVDRFFAQKRQERNKKKKSTNDEKSRK